MRETCTLQDCLELVADIAEELNIGWLQGNADANVRRRERMANRLLDRLKDVTPARATDGAKYLLKVWEKERMPRPKEIEQAIRSQGTTLTEATQRYLAWHDDREGLAGGAPCPVCGRPPSWAPRLMADCDPRLHYHASVPLVGCHPFLHEAANAMKKLHQPWPSHDDAYDQYATAGHSSLEPTGRPDYREVPDVRPQAD